MPRHALAISLLLTSLLLAACDRNKPGNPMPPQKPPMPKTEPEGPMRKPVWNAPVQPPRTHRA